MKKVYKCVKIALFEEYFDLSASVFQEYDFCGIEEGDDILSITFEESVYNRIDFEAIINNLKTFDKNVKILNVDTIIEKNWNEEWENQIQPVIANERIAIAPTHKANDIDSEIKIIIDPKMSFGTGHHNTTRLMCKLMDGLVKPGSFWIDVGTGTGVLAILAAKLDAAEVFAFDNDEWSIENTIENIHTNNEQDKIKVELADIDTVLLNKCDGIAANIFLNLALPSLSKFKNAVQDSRGDILISGILIYDSQTLIDEAEKQGLILVNKLVEEEWAAFHFVCGEN